MVGSFVQRGATVPICAVDCCTILHQHLWAHNFFFFHTSVRNFVILQKSITNKPKITKATYKDRHSLFYLFMQPSSNHLCHCQTHCQIYSLEVLCVSTVDVLSASYHFHYCRMLCLFCQPLHHSLHYFPGQAHRPNSWCVVKQA